MGKIDAWLRSLTHSGRRAFTKTCTNINFASQNWNAAHTNAWNHGSVCLPGTHLYERTTTAIACRAGPYASVSVCMCSSLCVICVYIPCTLRQSVMTPLGAMLTRVFFLYLEFYWFASFHTNFRLVFVYLFVVVVLRKSEAEAFWWCASIFIQFCFFSSLLFSASWLRAVS